MDSNINTLNSSHIVYVSSGEQHKLTRFANNMLLDVTLQCVFTVISQHVDGKDTLTLLQLFHTQLTLQKLSNSSDNSNKCHI